MAAKPDGPIIEYATPAPPSSSRRAIAIKFALIIAIFLSAVLLLYLPYGTWRFGPSPQVLIIMDEFGLTVGRCDLKGDFEDEYFHLGVVIWMFAKLSAVSFTVWVAIHLYSRQRAKRLAK